jgi:hypothetical protein
MRQRCRATPGTFWARRAQAQPPSAPAAAPVRHPGGSVPGAAGSRSPRRAAWNPQSACSSPCRRRGRSPGAASGIVDPRGTPALQASRGEPGGLAGLRGARRSRRAFAEPAAPLPRCGGPRHIKPPRLGRHQSRGPHRGPGARALFPAFLRPGGEIGPFPRGPLANHWETRQSKEQPNGPERRSVCYQGAGGR